MEKWINVQSLQLLNAELDAHKKNVPIHTWQVAAYRKEEHELKARLRLHIDIMKLKPRTFR
jgi:hypothetical protein